MAGLRLDRRKYALPNRIGANGVRIIPGKSESSRLYQRIAGLGTGTRMPPAGPLPAEQIALFKTWIDEGAEWPDAVSGDRGTAASVVDPKVVEMATALRNGDSHVFQRILHGNPKSVNGSGENGWTPLMYAALYGGPEEIKQLLDAGANPNQRNDDGATALLYAIDDPAKASLLLEKGADPKVRSGQGRTALVIASGWPGSAASVRLLLDQGVDPENAGDPNRIKPLVLAASSGAAETARLLVERGAKKPRLNGLSIHCEPCLDLLVPLSDAKDLGGLLEAAVLTGDLRLVRKLLELGAVAGSDLLQAVAISPTLIPRELFPTFVSRGASLTEKTSYGITLADLANRNRNAELTGFLREAGKGTGEIPAAAAAPVVKPPKPAGSARVAIERSLPLLQRSDVTFLQKAGCVSCHNNSLTAITASTARARGFAVNEQIASDQLRRISAFLLDNSAGGMENRGIPGNADTVSYILIGMAAENYRGDLATDIWARYLKNLQRPDGSWRVCWAARRSSRATFR
jgi:ankyrin repeat protein